MAIYMWREATPAGIYWSSTLGLITIADGAGNDITIADKNLGATQVWNSGNTLSEANCGKFYQWGNNYGFAWSGGISTFPYQQNASTYGPGNYYSSSLFIKNVKWDNSGNKNLRGGETGTNEAMQGPCDSGYHVPSNDEWIALYNLGITLGAWTSGVGSGISTYLKAPYAGYRDSQTSNVGDTGSNAYYWTSTASSQTSGHSYYFGYRAGNVYPNTTYWEGAGYSVRPFKNEAVQPDSSWTKLY